MFDGVLTTDTYVMDWKREDNRLIFDVVASLWPGHPSYETPLPNEWTCYKLARLIFNDVVCVVGLPDMSSVPSTTDPDGSVDFGSLAQLCREEGGYLIAGDFGEVHIRASSAELKILEQPAMQ